MKRYDNEQTAPVMSAPADPVGTQLAFFPPPAPPQGGETKAAAPADSLVTRLFGADGFNFLDILDIINPLQHIPFVSTLYRTLTGDTIAPVSRIAGGALFGGPIGAVVSLVNTIVAEWTGKDISDHAVGFVTGDESDDGEPQLAVDFPETEAAAGAPGETPGPAAGMAAGPPFAAHTLTTAVDEAARDAAAFARARHQSALLALAAQGDGVRPSSLAGAAPPPVWAAPGSAGARSDSATPGGWHSDVMLAALAKYEQSAKLARTAPQSTIDVAY